MSKILVWETAAIGILVVAIAAAFAALSWGGDSNEAKPDDEVLTSDLGTAILIDPIPIEGDASEFELQAAIDAIERIQDAERRRELRLVLGALDLSDWANGDVSRPEALTELKFICKMVPPAPSGTTFFVSDAQLATGRICRELPQALSTDDLPNWKGQVQTRVDITTLPDDAAMHVVANAKGLLAWAFSLRNDASASDSYPLAICNRVPSGGFGARSSPPFDDGHAATDTAVVAICADVLGGVARDVQLADRIVADLEYVVP